MLVNADFDGKEYLRCRVIINTVRIFFTEESNIGMQINMYCNASTVQIKSLQTIGRAENPPDSAVHGMGALPTHLRVVSRSTATSPMSTSGGRGQTP